MKIILEQVQVDKETKKKVELPITGMTCAACALSVERGLSKVRGIKNATVNLASEKATVEMEDPVDLKDMTEVVKNEGYGVLTRRMDFAVRGMTCAACVAAVEKALKGLYGVSSATVNLASEKASVEYISTIVGFDDFRKVVSEAGYSAEMIKEDYVDREKEQRERDFQDIRKKFLVSAVLTALVLIGSVIRIPILSRWELLFVLSTPVQFWAGMRFHKAAWSAIKHGATNMNTLITVGTFAAYIYSVIATFAPRFFFSWRYYS